jgi:hypothetical protein
VPIADGASQIAGQTKRSRAITLFASVWRELVAFRAGELQPGAGDTSCARRKQTRLRFLNTGWDERAGNDGRRAGAILARLPCQFPPVGPGGFTSASIQFAFYSSRINR